jgi:hypothetical protein
MVTSFAPLNFLVGGDSNFRVLLCFALPAEAFLGGMQNAVIEGFCEAAVDGVGLDGVGRVDSQATRDLHEGADRG